MQYKLRDRLLAVLIILCFCFLLAVGCSENKAANQQNQGEDVKANQGEKDPDEKISVEDPDRYVENIFPEIHVKKDVVYSEVTNYQGEKQELLLDVITPVGDTEKSRPAMIWIHGGGFREGNKEIGTEREFAEEFAKKGYVTLSINYRLRDNPSTDWRGTFIDSTSDAATAVNWLVEHAEEYGVNPNKIAIAGFSAGAAIVVNLAYRGDGPIEWEKERLFATVDIAGGELWMGSPQEGDPPALIIHGTKDSSVPYRDSEVFANRLNNAGVPHQLYPIEGASHFIGDYYDELMSVMTKFLYKELTGKEIPVTAE